MQTLGVTRGSLWAPLLVQGAGVGLQTHSRGFQGSWRSASNFRAGIKSVACLTNRLQTNKMYRMISEGSLVLTPWKCSPGHPQEQIPLLFFIPPPPVDLGKRHLRFHTQSSLWFNMHDDGSENTRFFAQTSPLLAFPSFHCSGKPPPEVPARVPARIPADPNRRGIFVLSRGTKSRRKSKARGQTGCGKPWAPSAPSLPTPQFLLLTFHLP